MENYSLTIKSDEKKGVLDDITSIIVAHEVNISYTHLFIEKNNVGTIDLELEHVEDIDSLIADLESLKEVKSVEIHSSIKYLWKTYYYCWWWSTGISSSFRCNH